MHRRPLLAMLRRYATLHPDEEGVRRALALVERTATCFERSCLPGHVTSSAWIASEDGARFLLTHHRKLDRWLQLGGHTDGDPDVVASALREAREESGMEEFELVAGAGGDALVDVDVHDIPAFGGEPAHEHHDVRVVLVARDGRAPRASAESIDVRWFGWNELAGLARGDESLLRLARKARVRLAAAGRAGAASVEPGLRLR
ncbi:MAG: NUDIX hydrolase [Myxococcota bacterium]